MTVAEGITACQCHYVSYPSMPGRAVLHFSNQKLYLWCAGKKRSKKQTGPEAIKRSSIVMKKNLIITQLAALLLLSACSTDFDLEAEWKDIPVVYSFFSVQDTAHYVRVEKAFLEPGGNAFEIAKISDSIYYSSLTVELENLTTGQSFVMEKVNGAEEGYPKEEGVFASEPNILYKLSAAAANISGGDSLLLAIRRGDQIAPALARTVVVGEITPKLFFPPDEIKRTRYNEPLNISWIPDDNARIFDLRFKINYLERLPGETTFTRKAATWVADRNVSFPNDNSDSYTYEASWESFYQSLATNIPEVEGATRLFENMDLFITGAGEEFFQFIRVSRANTGITSAQSTPTYTNVEGGLGIVSSRYTAERKGIILSQEALDSLRTGIYTRRLNFN